MTKYNTPRSIGMMCECGKYIETKKPDTNREVTIRCGDCKIVYQYASMNGRWYKVLAD